MKLKNICLALLAIFIFTGVTFPQIDTKNNAVGKDLIGSYMVNISGKVASTDTLTSAEFSLPEYDGVNWKTDPPIFAAQLTGTSTATRKITTQLLGSNFYQGSFVVVDTLLYKDSVNTEINKTFDANGKKYFRWKLRIIGAAGNNNTTFKEALYFYKRE
ncbi:MAG TPA: hypothetical protein VHO03_03675 [Ignavibacteriales bacterium]|nr:hypothetical protein [Ignavibacteriales bacterium]